MTDLEICQKIAEIEGIDFSVDGEHVFYKPDGWPCGYNPLTDKALCFDLMVKYSIEFTPEFEGDYTALIVDGYLYDERIDYDRCNTFGRDENPQRAICLAIIAKYEGRNND